MAYPETRSFNNSRELDLHLLDSIKRDVYDIKQAYSKIDSFRNHISSQIKQALEAQERLDRLVSYGTERPDLDQDSIQMDVLTELHELTKTVKNLKKRIVNRFSVSGLGFKFNAPGSFAHGMSSNDATKSMKKVPNLYKTAAFEHSSVFKDLVAVYDGLNIEEKMCLLCFSVFPENVIIKKRFMVYWWIGEGFLRPNPVSEMTAEQLGNEVFNKLVEKGFIEPFAEKRSLEVLANRCTMRPFVRAVVVTLADRVKFFNFDSEGNPTSDYSFSHRACLLAGEQFKKGNDMDKVHVLLNIDEMILEFEEPEMFSEMKNINVLCLGRWQASPDHYIELEDTNLLEEGLIKMKHLKYLSLQGISRIISLPRCLPNLENLTVLDLSSCHNLYKIPSQIGALKNLTHLDMSECYLLVNMPKEISSLSQLEVLKGFIVGISKGKNSCTLGHLAELPKLRKLSIYTGWEDFPVEPELRDLNRLKALCKMTIAWGAGLRGKSRNAKRKDKGGIKLTPTNLFKRICMCRTDGDASDCVTPELPSRLEKLDLRCFPQKHMPHWLMASKLKNLKKLYIRGGTLCDLGQSDHVPEECKWKVEILRLRFLVDLEMEWSELRKMFPSLIYVDKESCPKLTSFQCDEDGVRMIKIER